MDVATAVHEERSESRVLEYKDKRADTESIVIELVAFANTDGGHLILGVREEDDEIVNVHTVDKTGEQEEAIQNTIASKVEPRIHVECESVTVDGSQLFVVRVEGSDRLHSIELNGRPTYPVRQGSRIDYLHGHELYEQLGRDPQPSNANPSFSDAFKEEYDFSRRPSQVGGVSRIGKLEGHSDESPPKHSAPPNRLLIETPEEGIVLPAKTKIDPFSLDTLTFQLTDNVQVERCNDIEALVDAADNVLDANTSWDTYYTIHYGERQLVGRHIENFLQDSRRINVLATRMTPGSTSPSDPRPTGIIVMPGSSGLVWFKTEWRDGQLCPGRSQCGIVLSDLPFDQTHLQQFFDEIGGTPVKYDQESRIQYLNLNTDHELTNIETVLLKSELEDAHTEVVADNPLYQRPDLLAESFDQPIPRRFCEALAAVNRLSFDIRGGWLASDETFRLTDMEIFAIDASRQVYLVDGICSSMDEDPNPDLDPLIK